MSKNVKILVVTGVFINLEESDELSWILGYYTNLKELYKNFEYGNIQSYSTICSHIKKIGYYVSKNTRFWYKKDYRKFNEVIIREFKTNQLYSARKSVTLNNMISREIASANILVSMNLSIPD
jgi:phage anti-repressor protein